MVKYGRGAVDHEEALIKEDAELPPRASVDCELLGLCTHSHSFQFKERRDYCPEAKIPHP